VYSQTSNWTRRESANYQSPDISRTTSTRATHPAMAATIKKWCNLTAAAFIVSTFFLLCADQVARPDYTPHHPAEFQQSNHQCIDLVEDNSTASLIRGEVKTRIKTILLWNAPQRPEVVIFGTGHDAFVQHGCPVSDCELVNSPYQYPERPVDSYNAIVFNINDQFGVGSRRPYADGNQRPATQRYTSFLHRNHLRRWLIRIWPNTETTSTGP
jgi:alpha-1,3-fucosyltransferase